MLEDNEELELLEQEDSLEEGAQEGAGETPPAPPPEPETPPIAPPPPNPELELLDLYARQSGMTRRQYVEQLQQERQRSLEEQERRRLATRYPEAPPDLLGEVAGLAARQRDQDALRQFQQQEQTTRQRQREPWERFFQRNPTVETKELPPALWERVAAGEDPTAVWLDLQLAEKERELLEARQQQDTRRRSPGPVGSDGKEEEKDDFLAGLFD